jgi:hypothetical protein
MQAGALREGHHGHQPAVRHEVRVVEDGAGPGEGYETIARARCPLGMGDGSVENYHHPSSEGTPFAFPRQKPPLIHRWIEAKNGSIRQRRRSRLIRQRWGTGDIGRSGQTAESHRFVSLTRSQLAYPGRSLDFSLMNALSLQPRSDR